MKKTIVCIFAHPDDESFGPGGTIIKLAKENTVYIICVTDGDAGQCDLVEKEVLGEVRKKELLASAKILGIKKVFFLGYHDGMLSNNFYQEISLKIENLLYQLKPDKLLTFEQRGLSGHLDHIAVSMITTFIFEKIASVKELWYFCNSNVLTNHVKNYFVYFPKGYERETFDQVIDTTAVWDTKIKAMQEHKSQKADLVWWSDILDKVPREEYFMIVRK